MQAELALLHLKRAQELAKQHESLKAANVAVAALLREREWKKDLLLRNIIRQIKKQLHEGALLVLERQRSHLALICAHPICPAQDKAIPPEAYYITRVNGNVERLTYCLFCLEGLWNGKGLANNVDVSKINQLDGIPNHHPPKPSPLSQTHFQIPESRLSSKHAPPAAELATRSTGGRETTGSPVASPESITSEGEWRRPPTRFQYLAKFIKPGDSLTATEKAALELWKMASDEQLQWVGFRERYQRTVEELNNRSDEEDVDVLGGAEDSNAVRHLREGRPGDRGGIEEPSVRTHWLAGPQRQDLVQTGEGDLQREWESQTGLPKSQCRGKNLTAVLADVRSRGNGQVSLD